MKFRLFKIYSYELSLLKQRNYKGSLIEEEEAGEKEAGRWYFTRRIDLLSNLDLPSTLYGQANAHQCSFAIETKLQSHGSN